MAVRPATTPAIDERQDHRRPRGRDRLGEDHEDAGADRGADAEQRQLEQPDRAPELTAAVCPHPSRPPSPRPACGAASVDQSRLRIELVAMRGTLLASAIDPATVARTKLPPARLESRRLDVARPRARGSAHGRELHDAARHLRDPRVLPHEPTPIYFISPTAFNLLGIDRWLRNFFYVNYFDSFEGTHPRVFVPKELPYREFESMEDICNYLLGHKEVLDRIAARGGSGQVRVRDVRRRDRAGAPPPPASRSRTRRPSSATGWTRRSSPPSSATRRASRARRTRSAARRATRS